MRRKVLTRIGIVIASPVLFFALLELGVAIWGFQYPPADSPIAFVDPLLRVEGGLLHEPSVRQIWRPRPGAKIPWGNSDRVNEAGFRGPLIPTEKRPGVLRIATLGDSSTFGHSVAWEDTYSARLVGMLAQHGVQAEVIDAGVVGFSIRQGLERYREQVSPYRPDVVIAAFGAVIEHVGALGGVDDDELITRNVREQNPWVMRARRLRNNLRSLQFLAWCFDQVRGGRSREEEAWHAREVQQTMLNPTMGRVDWTGVRRVSLAEFEQDILLLRAEVERGGGRLLLLALAHRGQFEKDSPVVMEYYKKILEVGGREGIPVVDGRTAFAQAIRDGHWIPELMADNFHPAPLGHEYLARFLCDELIRILPTGEH